MTELAAASTGLASVSSLSDYRPFDVGAPNRC
jgi:hypothetical protein